MTKVNHPKICPEFEAAFELLGKRWTGLVIKSLLTGPKRFKEIAEMIPSMSGRVLTQRLRELEAAGMLKRIVYPEMPIRIEYDLTQKGHSLEPVMDEIEKWANTWAKS